MDFQFIETPPQLCSPEGLTDTQLYNLCREYGKQALHWRAKFVGLLPEVEKRRLYESYGFGSIFEFAATLAGLSQDHVRRVLCLEKRFEETPLLKDLLVSGEVSVHKLARVASIATPENEQELAAAVTVLPQSAVETLVRDEKFPSKTVRAHIELNSEVSERLARLQEKGVDVNQLLTEFLDKREEEIEEEKTNLAEAGSGARYMPAAVKKILKKEHGDKCSIPTCQKPSEQIHHTRRFSLSRSHDPHFLAPLCREHHQLAHLADQAYREMRVR